MFYADTEDKQTEVSMPLFDVYISPDEPVYVISVVSKLVDLPVWTLRQLDKAGVVCPKRIGKKSRLYSLKDIKRLEYVHYLMEEQRVNIHGIKIILKTEE
ncbi:MAG: MerR family transcriptional regulator [Candidatus Omnitrophica bacterium]|nr:MerR family transcriptional regulator [Candidatus Omnitrophota bacterium]